MTIKPFQRLSQRDGKLLKQFFASEHVPTPG